MGKMAHALIAYCGLYCGACSFRLAAQENNPEHINHMPSSYDSLKNKPLELCPGCRRENKCGECAIRDCAISKNIAFCSQCALLPCEKINAFNNDGKAHHNEIIQNLKLLQHIGEKRWVEHMEQRWTCRCGAKRSWYYSGCTCIPESMSNGI